MYIVFIYCVKGPKCQFIEGITLIVPASANFPQLWRGSQRLQNLQSCSPYGQSPPGTSPEPIFQIGQIGKFSISTHVTS
jgi:hypothetical protein